MEKQNKQARGGYDEEVQFPISYESHKSGTYNIYLFGQIESPNQFIGALEVMRNATENDEVVIHLQSCGGSLDATDTLLQAMHECQAPIFCKASGGCHSAASIILLAADSFQLSDNFSSLLHNGSTGSMGKFSDYRSETAFTSKWMEKVMRNAYEGFLNEVEIENLIKGVDIWLDAEEWVQRHNNRNEYIAMKMEEFRKAIEEDEIELDLSKSTSFSYVMEDTVQPSDIKPARKPRAKKAKAAVEES